jgi:hypothetical protein
MFTCDARSLALFRAATGLALLSQATALMRDFPPFFGEHGIYPDSGGMIPSMVLGVLPILAGCMVLGLFSRLAAFLSLIAVTIIQQTNPLIVEGGDQLLHVLLFWAILLPTDERWSLDQAWPMVLPPAPRLTQWACAGYTFQVCFLYWSAALLQSDPVWTRSGDALGYAVRIDHFTTPFGVSMLQKPDILCDATFATRWLEFLGPCLLLIPWKRDGFRLLAVLLFVGFHLLGMHALFRLGVLPWAGAAAWLPFVPGSMWDWMGRVLRARDLGALAASGRREPLPPLVICAGCMAVALATIDAASWTLSSLPNGPKFGIHPFGTILQQRWDMYAPCPKKEHGWLVVQADLENGRQVDLFTGEDVTWSKPRDIGAYFGDDLWRRYLSNLWERKNPDDMKAYTDFLVRNWNGHSNPSDQVHSVELIFMRETTQPDLVDSAAEQDTLYSEKFSSSPSAN